MENAAAVVVVVVVAAAVAVVAAAAVLNAYQADLTVMIDDGYEVHLVGNY